MKYMKNHFAGILSVILAVVSLSGSSMPVVSANSAERIAKKETIVKLDEKLGAEPGKVLEELKKPRKGRLLSGNALQRISSDSRELHASERSLRWKWGNELYRVLSLMFWKKCGADLSEIDKGSLRGGKVNASNWFHWMTDNAVDLSLQHH